MEVIVKVVDDFEEEKVIIQPENYFCETFTSVKEENPDWEPEKTRIPATVPLPILKSEPGSVKYVELTDSPTYSTKIELMDNVKVEAFFVDPSNASKIKREIDLDEKLKTELLSEECDLPTIKHEDINFDEPSRSSQESLVTFKMQAVKKVEKKRCSPSPVSRKECSRSSSRKVHSKKHLGKRVAWSFSGPFFIYRTLLQTHHFVHFIKEKVRPLQHIVAFDSKKTFSRTMCPKVYSFKSSLTRHLKGSTIENQFQCEICSKQFTHNSNLKRHMKTHSAEKPFKCEICSKPFTQNNNLKRHVKSHSAEKPFKCEICSKPFTQNNNLKRHVKTHSAERPFKCEICSKQFTQMTHLRCHMKTHSAEKPFKCEICSKQFIRKIYLKCHMETHIGKQPSCKCEICSKPFLRNGDLQRHMLIHTGEKPFKCEICSKQFTQNTSLQRHMKTHSAEEPFTYT